ncbi:leucyl/phenylalanyl-tRNA--protein transferase [Sulfitobacter sp. 1151]|uniref:Leucyl/phenylalanyl-tRNA--protein transferase n=1 Tax=Parasulfitobacter algicola TaxID=2614809 RepID=A0ABX2IXL9_9RHOB|nr:leucyl/phenylalanyl-tRNA--protein transferase [Sulfitobacter algicola]
MSQLALTPDVILRAYAAGIFPMSEARDDDDIFWVDPRRRGILPLDAFHISRSLKRRILRADYGISVNAMFSDVVAACADRKDTWISARIFNLYEELHDAGFAHSLEVKRDNQLIGGVYGVTIGGAFFGESMFSRQTDGSKIALTYLVHRLRVGRFTLFDTQFITPHLESLGAIEIDRTVYHDMLDKALDVDADFFAQGAAPAPQDVIQRNGQTS